MSRRLAIGLLAGIPLLLLAAGIAWTTREPGLPELLPAPTDAPLPDLAMSPLTEISASAAVAGAERYLSFTAAVSNLGPGAFIVHAVRADERGDWRVSQRFDEPDGSTSEETTGGDVVWGGHDHNHWHVHVGASYWLTRQGSSEPLRRYEKVGFCFFDQRPLVDQPADAPDRPRFPKASCNGEEALAFTMGLSPGWSDPYVWTLPDQRLLVSGLEDGVYRLWARADPADWFRESNEANNRTWVDVRLTLSTSPPRAEVVRVGPAGASPWVSG